MVRHRAARPRDRSGRLRGRGAARPGAFPGAVDLNPTAVRVVAGALGLRCLVWGRDADPTVLLVHGNGGHAHWGTPLLPALLPGWRLVVPALRGHREGDWPTTPPYRPGGLVGGLRAGSAGLGTR